MSSGLRRRFFNSVTNDSPNWSPDISREGSPNPEGDGFVHIRKDQAKKLTTKPKGVKRRNAWIFILGGLFGILVAGFFAGGNDLLDMASEMNLDLLFDVLPAGLIKDAKELQVSTSSRRSSRSRDLTRSNRKGNATQ